jgi:GNAT superfamily N-acetyltransferase
VTDLELEERPVSQPPRTSESPSHLEGYPSGLERQVVSSDGMLHFRLRPIRSDDGQRLVAFHNHLSDRSRYLRFFSLHPHLFAEEVERFTHVDYEDRLALVAELDDYLIGVGRYDRQPDSDVAEVAFVVADDYQHHGIGSLLLDELASVARDRGIRTFVADTLYENHPMLDVFSHSGFDVTSRCESGTVSLRFPLAPTHRSEAARAERRARWHVASSRTDDDAHDGVKRDGGGRQQR